MNTPNKAPQQPQVVTLDSPFEGKGPDSDPDVAIIEVSTGPEAKKLKLNGPGSAERPKKVRKVSQTKATETTTTAPPNVTVGPGSGLGFVYRPTLTGIGSHGLRFGTSQFSSEGSGPGVRLPYQFMRPPYYVKTTNTSAPAMNSVAPHADAEKDRDGLPGPAWTPAPTQVLVISGPGGPAGHIAPNSPLPPHSTSMPKKVTRLPRESTATEGSSLPSRSNSNAQARAHNFSSAFAQRLKDPDFEMKARLMSLTQRSRQTLKEKDEEIQRLTRKCITAQATKSKFEEQAFRLLEELRKQHLVSMQKEQEIMKLKDEVKRKNQELVEIQYPWIPPIELNCVCPKCFKKW